MPFSEGLAAVVIDKEPYSNQFAYIDTHGNPVILFDSHPKMKHSFKNGLAAFNDEYLDKTGKTIWPKQSTKVQKVKFDGFVFSRNGITILPRNNGRKSFNDTIWDAHINEEHGTIIAFTDNDVLYEAVLVPFGTDWFEHFIEAILEDYPEEVEEENLPDDPAKWRSMIRRVVDENVMFMLTDSDEDEPQPLLFLVTKKFYEELHVQ